MEYMRLIHVEIMARVARLQEDRQKMEEDVLGLLERVYEVTVRGTSSTLV